MSGFSASWLAIGVVLMSQLLSSYGARPQGPGTGRVWLAPPFSKLREFRDLNQALGASGFPGIGVGVPTSRGPPEPDGGGGGGGGGLGTGFVRNATPGARAAARRVRVAGSLAEISSYALHGRRSPLPSVQLPDPGWVIPSSMTVLSVVGREVSHLQNGTAIQEAWLDVLFDLLAGPDGNITANMWNTTFGEPNSLDMFAKMDPGGSGLVNRTAFKNGWDEGVDAMMGPTAPIRAAMEMAIFEELLYHVLAVDIFKRTVSWERIQNTSAKGRFGDAEESFKKEFGAGGMSPEGMHNYLLRVGAVFFPGDKQERPLPEPGAAPGAGSFATQRAAPSAAGLFLALLLVSSLAARG